MATKYFFITDLHGLNSAIESFNLQNIWPKSFQHVCVARRPYVAQLSGGILQWFRTMSFSDANKQDGSPANKSQPTKYWWNRNVFVLFGGHVDRSDVEDLFLSRVTEALIGEG